MALPTTRADFIQSIDRRLRNSQLQPDVLQLDPDELDELVDEALEWYNRDRPHVKVGRIAGDNSTFEFVLSTEFTDYVDGVSTVMEVRLSSTDATERGEDILPDESWEVALNTSNVEVLRVLTRDASTTEVLEVFYTLKHVLTEVAADSTVLGHEFFAFMNLAMSLACDRIATASMQLQDSNIDADSVSLETVSDRWLTRAASFMKKYDTQVKSVPGEAVRPAGHSISWYSQSQAEGDRRLSHQLFKKARSTRGRG